MRTEGAASDRRSRKVRALAHALLVFTLAAVAITLFAVADAIFSGDFHIAYYTAEGLQEFDQHSIPRWEQWFLIALLSIPNLCWLACLWPIYRLALDVRLGPGITANVVSRFKQFAWRLMINGGANLLIIPALNAFMETRGHSGPMKELWKMTLDSGGVDYITAGFLVVIICQLLESGLQAQEEARLTV